MQTQSEVSTRITMLNFLETGLSKGDILRFFEFSKWLPPPSWIFEIAKIYWLFGWRGSRRISMPNFVKIGHSFGKILRLFDFSRWRPSAILDSFGHIWTTDSEYLWVSITLRNLVMIDAVVFIIWTFHYLTRLAWKYLFTPQKLGFLGNLIP